MHNGPIFIQAIFGKKIGFQYLRKLFNDNKIYRQDVFRHEIKYFAKMQKQI